MISPIRSALLQIDITCLLYFVVNTKCAFKSKTALAVCLNIITFLTTLYYNFNHEDCLPVQDITNNRAKSHYEPMAGYAAVSVQLVIGR